MSKSPPPSASSDLAPFEVIRRLGAGGMAEVFLARKSGAEGTYKVLVVKRILPTFGASRRFRAMFVEEAQLATRLNHPNVVQVYEFYDGGDEGQLLAMEYVEGPDLGKLVTAAKAKGARIPPWVAAWIIAEAAKGLHYAHERKDEGGAPLEIVHRDVSPQNVLLSFEGGVKIADFGIASAKLFVDEQGVIKGKFGYMSPEQARGEKVDRRSDLYALGVILWETLAGRPLHGGLGGEALLDIVRSGLVEPPSTYVTDMPPELEAITMRALSPRREDRFPTARDMAGAIGRALFARQEFVDAGTLEAAIAELVPREASTASSSDLPPALAPMGDGGSLSGGEHRTQAAVPMALSSLEGHHAAAADLAAAAPEGDAPHLTPLGVRAPNAPAEGPREVRHVAVVTLKLHGLDPYGIREGVIAARSIDRLRTMLSDIAYKRGTQWIWQSEIEARATVGLGGNPSRAAADASWLALDTHEAIFGIKDDLALSLSASIGIVRGIASGARDPQGHLVRFKLHDPATFLADTLANETPLSRTWVAGGVYRIVRREFGWGDAPTLNLKPPPGAELPATMRIYALERSLSREERQEGAASAPSDLVGRELEKAELHAAYHNAVSGGGGVGEVTYRAVVGELGIGKTALVATFAVELPPNARLVRVECSPVRQELPLSAIAELVRDLIGATGEEPFDDVCGIIARAGGGAAQGDGTSPMVARLAELATNRPFAGGDEEDAATRKRAISSGVRNLFAAIALQQPLVVVVEGLQWADKASLELFAESMKTPDPLPILVVLVTRQDDRVSPLLESVVRVELRGLSTDEQIRLVEARLGVRDGVREVCADLVPKVAGNPFFLLEMVDALLERGTLEIREVAGVGTTAEGEAHHQLARTDRADASSAALPQTLEQLVGDRLVELPVEERELVGWLAVAGGPLSLAELGTLGGAALEEASIRLCARGLCDRKGETVDFRHPLTRDVAYAALEPATGAVLHRRLGEHWANTSLGRGQAAAIVARHLALGGDGARASEFYLEAAAAARTNYQTQLSIRYYARAIASLPAGDARGFVPHEALEGIYRVIGRRRERVRHLEALRRAARSGGTPRNAALALLRTARFDLDEGRPARGLPVARKGAELARAAGLPPLEVEAEVLTSTLQRELGDVQGALAACDRALAACDPKLYPNIPPRARAEVLQARGVLLRWVGRVKEAIDSYAEAIAVFRKVGARRLEARTKNSLAWAMFVQGRYEDAVALALESIQIDLAIGGRFQIAKTLCNIGFAYARLGDLPRAQAYMARARDAHERYSDQDSRVDTLLVSSQIMIEAGEYDQAETFLRDASALNAATGMPYALTQEAIVRSALARVRREAPIALDQAMVARRLAERLALVNYHFYALALEAAARIDLGEVHAATLAATTALGAVETLQGCEHGLEIRVLCADALKRAGSPQAPLAAQRAVDYATSLLAGIKDTRLRRSFAQRPLVAGLFDATPLPQTSGEPSRVSARSPDAAPPTVAVPVSEGGGA